MTKTELIEFITVLGNYFDLGSFYVTRSYVNKMFDTIDSYSRFSSDELHNILIRGAFDEDEIGKSEIVWKHV